MALHAFAWGVCAPNLYPTLTVHGSNAPEFMADHAVVSFGTRTAGAVFTDNQHELAGSDVTKLWELHLNQGPGSPWAPADVAAGTLDLYYTRLSASPRYSRLWADGSEQLEDATALLGAGHAYPTADYTPPSFRYYAFVVSVGRVVGITEPHVLEVLQFQPVIEAPAAAVLPSNGTATVYGRGRLPAGSALLEITLTKSLPAAEPLLYGYAELWNRFRSRGYYTQGKAWSSASFPSDGSLVGRRALVMLPEVLVPRTTLIRTRNSAITTVPFLWCYIRQRSLRPVGSQSSIVNRVADLDRSLPGAHYPPDWIDQSDTMRFLLVLGSARIPGESQFITLSTDSSVLVDTLDTPGSSVPEICLTLPSGEILDFQMYDGAADLPNEVPHDEWAGIYATVRVVFLKDDAKQARADSGGAPSTSSSSYGADQEYADDPSASSSGGGAAAGPGGALVRRTGRKRCGAFIL